MAEDGGDTKWQGYSAYKEVASKLHESIMQAANAYSHLKAKDSQGVGITPQTAVKGKGRILRVSKRLSVEVRRNRDVDDYSEVYERWFGKELVDGEWVDTGDGHMAMLESQSLRTGLPEWLDQHMDDILYVGWKLGYIRSGVDKPADPDEDETQVEEMFK